MPSASLAATLKVWPPTPRPVYSAGEVQAWYAPSSSEHSNVEPSLLEANSNVAVVLAVVSGGPETIVV